MRSISDEIKSKLENRIQTPGNNADHKMEIIVSRSKDSVTDSNRFMVSEIRQKEGLGDLGIDIYRPKGELVKIYEVHNDNNVIMTSTRDMPALPENEWIDGSVIDSGNLCNLIFNGKWVWNEEKQKYLFWSVGDPFLFFTDLSDNLYVQIWEDNSSRNQIATDVQHFSVIRGWKSNANKEADQGLIAAYIKSDGYLYYKNYTWDEVNEEYRWEQERRIYFNKISEVLTLYLGGATGGTYTLGTSTLNYNDDATTIQTALESQFGSGLVTVEDDNDFKITFDTSTETSGLTADFTNLTDATSPTLTITTPYSDQGGNANNITMFLTSDYRTGFVISTDLNEIFWEITKRQWSGLAIRGEAVQASLCDIEIERTKIDFIKFYPGETVQAELTDLTLDRLYGISPLMISAKNIDDGSGDYGLKIEIEFDEDVFDISGNYNKFSITDNADPVVSFPPTGIEYKTGYANVIVLTCTDFNGATNDITITYTLSTGLGIKGEAGQDLETQSISFTASDLVPPALPAPIPLGALNIEGEELS